MKSLWGDEFVIEDSAKQAKSLLKKIEKPKKTEQQILKSKNTSIEDKLNIIYNNVNRILGVYKENTLVIKDKETLSNYIYNYPRKVFGVFHDEALEFYSYYIERIDNIIIKLNYLN